MAPRKEKGDKESKDKGEDGELLQLLACSFFCPFSYQQPLRIYTQRVKFYLIFNDFQIGATMILEYLREFLSLKQKEQE